MSVGKLFLLVGRFFCRLGKKIRLEKKFRLANLFFVVWQLFFLSVGGEIGGGNNLSVEKKFNRLGKKVCWLEIFFCRLKISFVGWKLFLSVEEKVCPLGNQIRRLD